MTGTGIVEVQLNYGGGQARDGLTVESDFPFDFDVVLRRHLGRIEIETVESLTVDTSSF